MLFDIEVGGLEPYEEAGLIGPLGRSFARALAERTGEHRLEVLLAAAMTLQALRLGHLYFDLAEPVPGELDAGAPSPPGVRWPNPAQWSVLLSASPVVRSAAEPPRDRIVPLVLDGTRCYLDRYFDYECTVARGLGLRLASRERAAGQVPLDAVEPALRAVLGDAAPASQQRVAVERALRGPLTVIAGGPGTGKTWTIARLLETALACGLENDAIALCAPTGKAAARLAEALGLDHELGPRPVEAVTLHRLLGADRAGGFRRGPRDLLAERLVIVDEASMVSASLMAHLVGALSPECALVLVGDPFQLASVEAGAVLGEIVSFALGQPIDSSERESVVVLDKGHRFGEESGVFLLADAVRRGSVDDVTALFGAPAEGISFVASDDELARREVADCLADAGAQVVELARAGDAVGALRALGRTKVLCGTRHGPSGSNAWTEEIEARLARRCPGVQPGGWYAGRPVIVTENDYPNRLFNGDSGIVMGDGHGLEVLFSGDDGLRPVRASQLRAQESWWAMTVHRSQGSEFDEVVVSLPDAGSPVLSRELLYTAVTRARRKVTVIASREALAEAVGGRMVRRSALAERLGSVCARGPLQPG